MFYEILSKTDLFKGIARDDIKAMIDCFKPVKKKYAKGDIIFRAEDTVPKAGIVLSGSVNLVVNHPWGTSSIYAHVHESGVFGGSHPFSAERRILCDMVAAEDCEILLFDIFKTVKVCDKCHKYHVDVMYNIECIMAERCKKLQTKMTHTAPKLLRHRLMSYLSEQAKINNSRKFRIPFTQKQLADYLNSERAATSHELSKMKRDGLIDYHKFDFEIFFGDR